MKVTTLLFFLALMQVTASSYSQQTRLSLKFERETLESVFSKIEANSEFSIFYKNEMIQNSKEVTAEFKNALIFDVLDQVLKTENLTYSVRNKLIMIVPKTDAGNENNSQQQKSISGKVTDSTGAPLPGVTVVVKGTTAGIITDAQGKYSLSSISADATLVFSFVGMKKQEISVGGKTTINVTLAEESVGIEEVVAIGYGTKIKGELTGAIAKTDSKIFETRPVTNTLNALQGALPGVTIIRGNGRPGNNNYTMQIRGISSYSGSKPLILIDGVAGDLNLINPSDILDVTVLKDAAASIYGARAADGVILVTTRKGTKGKATVSYSGNYGVKTPKYLKEYASTLHMAEMYDQAMTNIGQPGVSQEIFDKIRANAAPDVSGGWVKYLEGFPGFFGNHNWNDDVYGNGIQQNHNVSISGGGDDNTYLFSAGYNSDEGVFNYGENKANRYNLRMNYDFRLFDRLNIETRTSFDNQGVDEPGNLAEALRVLPRMWNFLPVYNPSGQFYEYIGYGNPVQELLIGKSTAKNSKFSTNIKGDLKIIDDLKLTAQVGFTNGYSFANDNHPRYYRYAWEGGETPVTTGRYSTSWATYNNSKSFFGSYTTYLDYNKVLFNKHRLGFMAGASHEEFDFQNQSTTGYNFLSNELFTLNLADRTKVEYSNFTGSASDWALSSYFGRFSYSINKKYYLDFTTRIDGSSKFAPSKRWSAVFPAVSAAWNLSQEKFIKSLNTFDNLKLRASWGQSGNQELAFGNYDYFPLISITGKIPLGSPNSGLPGAVSTIASETRTWETIETRNAGLDFAVLNSRLTGSFDYYIKYNNDMLVSKQLPATLGGTAPTQNIGKLETKGWDISVGWSDTKGDFKYSVSATISDSKNKMIELQGNDAYREGLVYAREGYSMYSFFGYEDAIIQNEDQLASYKASISNEPLQLSVGDMMYRDIDGDGKISPFGDDKLGTKGDMKYLGNYLPRYTYSANLSLSYKNFDFSMFLQGVGQREGIRVGDFGYPFYFIWHQPLEYFYGKTWTPENTDAPYPRIIPGGMGYDGLRNWNWKHSNSRFDNLAYLRIKTLTLTYNLPQSFCDKLKMQSARIYASGQDLFTIAKGTWEKSFDPEETWERNDEQTYPFSSVISLGLDIKF
jgi:TonB-linked SusC/RagA family outer membrane protein